MFPPMWPLSMNYSFYTPSSPVLLCWTMKEISMAFVPDA